jgi:AcrR family transcriptional regulator
VVDEQRPSVREENRRRVEQRIVAAAVEIVEERGAIDFTVPEVAERSGVALRTLYRYFPNRQDLVSRLAQVADQVEVLAPPQTLEEIEDWLIAAWTNLQTVAPFLRAQHQGEEGRSMRQQRAPRHRAITSELLGSVRGDLSPVAHEQLCDQVLLHSSSAAMFEWTDVIGLSVEDAARRAADAIVTLIDNAPSA